MIKSIFNGMINGNKGETQSVYLTLSERMTSLTHSVYIVYEAKGVDTQSFSQSYIPVVNNERITEIEVYFDGDLFNNNSYDYYAYEDGTDKFLEKGLLQIIQSGGTISYYDSGLTTSNTYFTDENGNTYLR